MTTRRTSELTGAAAVTIATMALVACSHSSPSATSSGTWVEVAVPNSAVRAKFPQKPLFASRKGTDGEKPFSIGVAAVRVDGHTRYGVEVTNLSQSIPENQLDDDLRLAISGFARHAGADISNWQAATFHGKYAQSADLTLGGVVLHVLDALVSRDETLLVIAPAGKEFDTLSAGVSFE